MSRLRFRYALEPMLSTRRWALDALRLALTECNTQISEHAAVQADTRARYDSASAEWHAVAASGQAQPMQRFGLGVRYLGDLAMQLSEHATRTARLASARDEVIAQLVAAQHAVEAAEQHREAMKQQFVRQRASADFKLADDQWNTLHTGDANHGH
jgi:hypothetical protein